MNVVALRKPVQSRGFRVGQVWRERKWDDSLMRDVWRIEAITNHPDSPVIARHECGLVQPYGLDGSYEGNSDQESDLDLVTLVEDVPRDDRSGFDYGADHDAEVVA